VAGLIISITFVAQYEQFSLLVLRVLAPAVTILLIARFRSDFFSPPTEIRWFGAFIAWSLFGSFNAVEFDLYWRILRLLVQIAILMLAVYVVVLRARTVQPILWGFVLTAACFVVRTYATGELARLEEKDYPALAGTIGANGYAFIMLIGITALLMLWRPKQPIWRYGLMIGLGTVFASNLVATASRKAFFALVLTLVLWAVWCVRRRMSRMGPLSVAGVLLGLALPVVLLLTVQGTFLETRLAKVREDPELQLKHRGALYSEGLEMIRSNPFIGVGLGNFVVHSPTEGYAHSDALEVAATTGLVGLLIYGGMYAAFLRRAWNLRRQITDRQQLYMMDLVFVFLAGQAVISFGRPNFMDIVYMPFFALMVGLVASIDMRLRWARRQAAMTG
jgi:O-antigen ligase